MSIEDALDLAMLVAVLVVLTPIVIFQTYILNEEGMGGFGYLREKTMKTVIEMSPELEDPSYSRRYDVNDILLITAINDDASPKPKTITYEYNPQYVIFDRNFRENRDRQIAVAATNAPTNRTAKRFVIRYRIVPGEGISSWGLFNVGTLEEELVESGLPGSTTPPPPAPTIPGMTTQSPTFLGY